MTPPNTQESRKRWAIWLPLLAASAYLALGDANDSRSDSDQVVRTAARKAPRSPMASSDRPAEGTQPTAVALISRDELYPNGFARKSGKDLFAATDWSPPPPPPAAAPAPAPPTAPAIPFSFLGKRKTANAWEVFLGKGEVTYIVREGQTFADSYRVEKIQPPQMTLTFLPLSQPQTLSVGEAR